MTRVDYFSQFLEPKFSLERIHVLAVGLSDRYQDSLNNDPNWKKNIGKNSSHSLLELGNISSVMTVAVMTITFW